MITGFVKGQSLRLVIPPVVADSLSYLTGKFVFQTADWTYPGMSVWAHFRKGETQIDAELHNGEFGTDAGVNLSEGEWEVWLTGHALDDNMIRDGDTYVVGSKIGVFSQMNPIRLIAGHEYEFSLGENTCLGYEYSAQTLSPTPRYSGMGVSWATYRSSFVYVPANTTNHFFRLTGVAGRHGVPLPDLSVVEVTLIDKSAARRVTSNVAKIKVLPSGVIENEPLPTYSFGEAILAEVKRLYDSVGDMIRDAHDDVAEQLDDQAQDVEDTLGTYSQAFSQQLVNQSIQIENQLNTQNANIASQLSQQNTAVTNQLSQQNTSIANQLEAQDTAVESQLNAQDAAVDARLDANEALIDAAFGGLKNWRDGLWLKLWSGSEEDFAAVSSPAADTIYLVGFPLSGSPAPNESEVSG